jgi:uncharacterized membrane protein
MSRFPTSIAQNITAIFGDIELASLTASRARPFLTFYWHISCSEDSLHKQKEAGISREGGLKDMASKASINRHPIHPMLIPFPIGLLVFSVIADLIYLGGGNPVWHSDIAFYTLLGGIIGALAAAVPGLIDWATLTDPATVRTANWHARVNIITVVIFVVSFYLRTARGSQWISSVPSLPVFLSLIGLVGLGIGGWLGGELVFKHRVAVTSEAEQRREQPVTDRARAA